MRARAISFSLSLSLSAAAAIAENMRNQAQSPKVQHVLSSLLSLSFLVCRSEQLKLRIRIGDTPSARHAQVVAVAVNERGGERETEHTNK